MVMRYPLRFCTPVYHILHLTAWLVVDSRGLSLLRVADTNNHSETGMVAKTADPVSEVSHFYSQNFDPSGRVCLLCIP